MWIFIWHNRYKSEGDLYWLLISLWCHFLVQLVVMYLQLICLESLLLPPEFGLMSNNKHRALNDIFHISHGVQHFHFVLCISFEDVALVSDISKREIWLCTFTFRFTEIFPSVLDCAGVCLFFYTGFKYTAYEIDLLFALLIDYSIVLFYVVLCMSMYAYGLTLHVLPLW